MDRPPRLILATLAAGLLASGDAQAALGDAADSETAQRFDLATRRSTAVVGGHYWVRETVSDSTTVREYVSASGIVFGIAWEGLTHPDLTSLLGAYASEYHAAVQGIPHTPGRRWHQVKTNRLVVEQWGHMRHLQGRAYVPLLVSPGVSVDEIK